MFHNDNYILQWTKFFFFTRRLLELLHFDPLVGSIKPIYRMRDFKWHSIPTIFRRDRRIDQWMPISVIYGFISRNSSSSSLTLFTTILQEAQNNFTIHQMITKHWIIKRSHWNLFKTHLNIDLHSFRHDHRLTCHIITECFCNHTLVHWTSEEEGINLHSRL